MTKKFVQPGNVLDHTPAADVANGAMVVIGSRVGIALNAIPANTTGALAVAGVFTYAKAAGAISQGDALYYDAAADVLTTTATDNTAAGYAAADAVAGAETVNVALNG